MDKKWFEQLLKVLLNGLFLLTSVAKSEKLFPALVNNSKIQLNKVDPIVQTNNALI